MAATSFCNRIHNSTNASHSQLVRSLERILEEANISGELILTNRKLKDFPKTATKFNLSDTIMADLSRNRFCELPEEVTTFAFLETLLLYHNTIRHIPESVQHLTSLTFLDLRSNHISVLPKELCFMPLQVLLISNNRLVSLPDELGRMDKLTDLDASYNQLTALPPRIGELRNLKSLSLRNNQILYLSRELACLSLVFLDVSNNKITNLPLEMRQMTTLVEFNLENNPLASPPASLCIRGLVHIFKFLETQATKDEKGFRSGGNYDGYTTLQRTPKINSGNLFESTRNPRNQSETQLYNTYDGSEKHWSRDLHSRNFKTDISTPKKVVSPSTIEDFFFAACTNEHATIPKSGKKATKETVPNIFSQQGLINDEKVLNDYSNSTSSPIPDDEMLIENHRFNDKNSKELGNVQTYREYKEALKQQRNQETSSRIYKAKGKTPYDTTGANEITYSGNSSEDLEHYRKEEGLGHWNGSQEDSIYVSKKPIQTVVPVRITEPTTAFFQPKIKEKNSNQNTISECLGYVKPDSPIKTNFQPDNSINNNSVPVNGGNKNKFLSEIATKSQQQFLLHSKTQKSVTWNQEVSSEKLSFTMRREFDRQREETELLMQLRNIIQNCLKTVLPEDVSSALADGVVLCHLANYVRPRSVASIHVPSPGVSKLTMARCRRNVDNFLEACRKIGVDEELICSCEDVLPTPDDGLLSSATSLPPLLRNPSAVLKIVSAFLQIKLNIPIHHQVNHYRRQQHLQLIKACQLPGSSSIPSKENQVNIVCGITRTKKGLSEVHVGRSKIKRVKKKINFKNNFNKIINSKFISGGGKVFSWQTNKENKPDTNTNKMVTQTRSPVSDKANNRKALKMKLHNIFCKNNKKKLSKNIFVWNTQCNSKNNNTTIMSKINSQEITWTRISIFESNCTSNNPLKEVNFKATNFCDPYKAKHTDGEKGATKENCSWNHGIDMTTIVLSCVFIATFALVIIFPILN